MNGIFLDHLEFTRQFGQGIFWCVRQPPTRAALSPLTQALADTIGANFTCVQIQDFDDLFDRDLWGMLAATSSQPPPKLPTVGISELPLDMRPSTSESRRNLDESLLRARLIQYAGKLESRCLRLWTHAGSLKQRQRLISFVSNRTAPKFSLTPQYCCSPKDLAFSFPSAHVHVAIVGPATCCETCLGADTDLSGPNEDGEHIVEQNIEGNLWSQVDQLTDLLTLFTIRSV